MFESSAEFKTVVVVDIVDLFLALFVPAAQVGDFFTQVECTQEETNSEPSGNQSGGVGVLSGIGVPNLSLGKSQGLSGINTGRSHNNRLDVFVIPAVDFPGADLFSFITFANHLANLVVTFIWVLVQICFRVPNPKPEAKEHHNTDE